MKFEPNFLGTGIGSLPYREADKAMRLIREYMGYIPHWPQLPHLGEEEGFVEQFVAPLMELGIVVSKEGRLFFDNGQPDWADKMTRFYSLFLAAQEDEQEAKEFFRFTEKSAAGFYYFMEDMAKYGTGDARYVKGQISGPVTLGFRLTDQNRRAIYYDEQLRDILVKTLALQGFWQAKAMAGFGVPVIIFVDDPGLYAYGASTHITLKREDIITDLKVIYEVIRSAGALAGTHSCAGMDWSILFEAGVDIVSFDAYEYFNTMQSYPGEAKEFINRGGVFAWGIVPTSEKVWDESVDTLEEKINQCLDFFAAKGIDRQKLIRQSMVTPSCGTGTLSTETAERIYQLTGLLSERMRGQQV